MLIADDQPELRDALKCLIDNEPGLELVAVATDALEAIALARLHQPDVALIDFKMPGGGGPRATREIAVHSPRTRVVALSAYEDRAAVLEMLQSGAVAYLVKGTPAQGIRDTIARSLRGESFLSPEVTGDVVRELSDQLQRNAALSEREQARRDRVRAAIAGAAVTIVFQPIVELPGGTPVGFEALARFGLEPAQPPNIWFADAAAVGLQAELERKILHEATGRLGSVTKGTYLSVNISPEVVTAPEIVRELATLPAEQIVLELTEHVPVNDYPALKVALSDFRDRGGRIAVDDAGAGFASLRHVLQLAPDFLKIDGGVVAELETSSSARALTSALTVFAHEMGQVVVAEGIENAAVVSILTELGVTHGQGFHFGRPEALPLV